MHIKYLSKIGPGHYKVDVNTRFTKSEIRSMVETMFNVRVLQINTLRTRSQTKGLGLHKRAYIKTQGDLNLV